MISEITLMDVLNSRMGNDRKERLMDLSKIKNTHSEEQWKEILKKKKLQGNVGQGQNV